MKLFSTIIATAAITLAASSTAYAKDSFHIGINIGGYTPHSHTIVTHRYAPTYYGHYGAPHVYYSSPRVIYYDAPVRYHYRPHVYIGHHGHSYYGKKHHYKKRHHYKRHHKHKHYRGHSRGHDRHGWR